MEPGAGPTKCSGPRPRLTAAKPRSLSPFWFCHFRKHSFLLGGGDSAAPRPCPVTPPPPGRARAGSPSHPSQAGPHSLTSSQTPARRPEGEGRLLAGQGALSAWWWGVPAARALPQRQGELAWLREVSASARAADMLCLEPRVRHFGVQMVTAPCSQPLPAECTPCAPPPFTSCILQARDIPSGHPNEPYSSPVALQSRLKAPPVRNVPLELLPDRLTQQS